METYALYVGATDGIVDMPRIETIVSKSHAGFTMVRGTGHWQGLAEDMVMLVISDDEASVTDTARTLKAELDQQAIAIQRMPDLTFV